MNDHGHPFQVQLGTYHIKPVLATSLFGNSRLRNLPTKLPAKVSFDVIAILYQIREAPLVYSSAVTTLVVTLSNFENLRDYSSALSVVIGVS